MAVMSATLRMEYAAVPWFILCDICSNTVNKSNAKASTMCLQFTTYILNDVWVIN